MAKYYVTLVEDENGNWKQVCSDDYIDMTHYDANLTDEGAIRAFKSKHNIFDEDGKMREHFKEVALRQIKELCSLKDNGEVVHSEYLELLGVTPTLTFGQTVDKYINSIISHLVANTGWNVEAVEKFISDYENNENPIDTLARKTGRSRMAIYNLTKKLGRLPTEEEVLSQKVGRPRKYE